MKIEEALNSSQALMQFGQQKLPFQVALDVAHNQRQLQEVAKEYDKRRLELVEKYGKKDKETGHTNVEPRHQKTFSDKINDVVAQHIEIDLKQISQELLDDNFEIEPNTMVHLPWLFS